MVSWLSILLPIDKCLEVIEMDASRVTTVSLNQNKKKCRGDTHAQSPEQE